MVAAAVAQPARTPFQAQATSTIAFTVQGDESAVEIANTAYELAGPGIPTRPPDELMVLRKTTRTRHVLGDIGTASTTIEAWPLGVDPRERPRYAVTVEADGCQAIDSALLVVSRGLEETSWWSV